MVMTDETTSRKDQLGFLIHFGQPKLSQSLPVLANLIWWNLQEWIRTSSLIILFRIIRELEFRETGGTKDLGVTIISSSTAKIRKSSTVHAFHFSVQHYYQGFQVGKILHSILQECSCADFFKTKQIRFCSCRYHTEKSFRLPRYFFFCWTKLI